MSTPPSSLKMRLCLPFVAREDHFLSLLASGCNQWFVDRSSGLKLKKLSISRLLASPPPWNETSNRARARSQDRLQARRREVVSLNGHVKQRSSVHSGPWDKRNNLPQSLGLLGSLLQSYRLSCKTPRAHVKNQGNSNWLGPSQHLSCTVPGL